MLAYLGFASLWIVLALSAMLWPRRRVENPFQDMERYHPLPSEERHEGGRKVA